jgi:hypothetical protein
MRDILSQIAHPSSPSHRCKQVDDHVAEHVLIQPAVGLALSSSLASIAMVRPAQSRGGTKKKKNNKKGRAAQGGEVSCAILRGN